MHRSAPPDPHAQHRRPAMHGPSRRAVLAGAASLAALGLARPAAAATLGVVATTGMIVDAARVVGGETVAVRALMGPGVDPHAYRQTRTDIAAMARADLVLRHGLYLEAQMEEFFEKLAARVPLVTVAETLPRDRLLGWPAYPGRHDPHVWMDPKLWAECSRAVEAALAEHAGADGIAERAEAYRGEMAALDAYAAGVMASVPESARVLVTAHDAFNYFGRAYGVDVLGIQGISTESEAGLQRIEELVAAIVERKVRAVFVESSVSERNVRALIEGARARGHEVVIGGTLFSDAMGQDGTYEGTYLGMIDHNVTTIARALGGTAPAGGMRGRLATT